MSMTWGLHYEPNDFWRYTKYSLLMLAGNCDMHVVGIKRIGGIFTQIGARLVDVSFETIKNIEGFSSIENQERLGIIITLPFSSFLLIW